jgi:hypothetical protein
MPNRKLLGVLLDTETSTAKAVHLDDSLESFYKALHCTTIDIVNREVAGKRFDIVCDDEARLKANPRMTAIGTSFGSEQELFGSLFVVGEADAEGNLSSLTKEDVKHILSHCHAWYAFNDIYYGGRPMRVLHRVSL